MMIWTFSPTQLRCEPDPWRRNGPLPELQLPARGVFLTGGLGLQPARHDATRRWWLDRPQLRRPAQPDLLPAYAGPYRQCQQRWRGGRTHPAVLSSITKKESLPTVLIDRGLSARRMPLRGSVGPRMRLQFGARPGSMALRNLRRVAAPSTLLSGSASVRIQATAGVRGPHRDLRAALRSPFCRCKRLRSR